MRRVRQDLDWIVSAGLLLAVAATGITGVIADLWDLNDFWYHTVAGYLMGGFAIAHVAFNWSRLVAYARFRFQRPDPAGRPPNRVDSRRSQTRRETEVRDADLRRLVVSRRGLLGFAIGGAGGWLLGRGLRPPPQIAAGSDVGVIYHEWSKPGVIDALGSVANWGQFPDLYKRYPDAPRVTLPSPDLDAGAPTARTIAERRSTRAYAPRPLTRSELAHVLFLTTGITRDRWGQARRSAPSSGALYPIETYVAVHDVDGVDRGIYHYALREHDLEQIRQGDFRADTVAQALGQEFLGECGAVLFLTNILQRMRPKYQDRSYRYGLLEAGHIGENAYLAAVSLGLGACGVGAFMDDQINAMLGVDGVEEAAVYMLAVGHT
jgi:SagB-type dehydrogenase family enzyme